MALSSLRRQQLRLYLCYPSTGLQTDRTLENAMNAVDAQGRPELETMIEAELDACIQVDADIRSALARMKYKQVEDVHFNVGGELYAVASRGMMHVRRLGNLVGCEPRGNPFSSGSYCNSNAMLWG